MNRTFALLCGALTLLSLPALGQTVRSAGHVGVELDGIGDGNRAKPFIDLAKTLRPWMKIGAQDAAPVDESGWPTTDAATVLFDIRPAYAWAPPMDDPDKFQPDWSGTYNFSFKGRADVATVEDNRSQIVGLKYDSATNLSTGKIVVPKGAGLLILSFTATRRTPSSPVGSGITGLRVLRPGYPLTTNETFTSEFLRSLAPFAALRCMDWLDTNHNPGYYGDAGHHALEWKDRRLPTDATQVSSGAKYGVAWEYVVQLANRTGKDLWINIPVAATDDYITRLAKMLKKDLKPGLNIYVEHSNEVWNFGFPQYIYNKLAAIDEVKRGGSTLNNDGSKEEEVWTHRRHAKRLIEIAKICESVFGPGSLNKRVRPVYASWVISPDPHYRDVLQWVEKTYGPPKSYFTAIAGAAYFNAEKAGPTATVSQVLDAMRANTDENLKFRTALQQIAAQYGLKHFQYEVGPDTGGGKVENVANRIRANRDPRMREIILHDARDNWFARGGDLYMYFSHISAYSRHGCWGLSEDVENLHTPKWEAIYDLTK
jgi:hypothetical protein